MVTFAHFLDFERPWAFSPRLPPSISDRVLRSSRRTLWEVQRRGRPPEPIDAFLLESFCCKPITVRLGPVFLAGHRRVPPTMMVHVPHFIAAGGRLSHVSLSATAFVVSVVVVYSHPSTSYPSKEYHGGRGGVALILCFTTLRSEAETAF